ncbi:hypothetical protein EV06_0912 [Prochlorococcus sp. MIT 0602]|nr:hypothetical protein EV06_0912 [Prochlorococcus sp. MIT 0602]KGG17320.1 hypothetical protein EV07_0758 [Prochlorococcus sp. MIT 0603]
MIKEKPLLKSKGFSFIIGKPKKIQMIFKKTRAFSELIESCISSLN